MKSVKKKLFACAGGVCDACNIGWHRAMQQKSAENLLSSTEMLLMSQVNLGMLALDLISTNMQNDYTTVDQDRESLGTIIESLDMSKEFTDALLKSKDIGG